MFSAMLSVFSAMLSDCNEIETEIFSVPAPRLLPLTLLGIK